MIEACPKCGCNELVPRGRVMRWGQAWERLACGHCGHAMSDAPAEAPAAGAGGVVEVELAVVVYRVLRCPHCGSERTVVTSTQRPFRYHQCRDCGRNFKSVEE